MGSPDGGSARAPRHCMTRATAGRRARSLPSPRGHRGQDRREHGLVPIAPASTTIRWSLPVPMTATTRPSSSVIQVTAVPATWSWRPGVAAAGIAALTYLRRSATYQTSGSPARHAPATQGGRELGQLDVHAVVVVPGSHVAATPIARVSDVPRG
jgi:hypothetical protein